MAEQNTTDPTGLRAAAEWLLNEWDANTESRGGYYMPSCIEQLREAMGCEIAQGTEVDRLRAIVSAYVKADDDLSALADKYRMDWSDFDGRQLRAEVQGILNPARSLIGRGDIPTELLPVEEAS